MFRMSNLVLCSISMVIAVLSSLVLIPCDWVNSTVNQVEIHVVVMLTLGNTESVRWTSRQGYGDRAW
jgi:hypothetical protein